MEKVLFNNSELLVGTDVDGTQVAALTPICDALGIDAPTQYVKLCRDPRFSRRDIPSTGSDGKTYTMFCLPITQIDGWLFTINANKIKPESRKLLLQYQHECMRVLHAHFRTDTFVVPPAEFFALQDRVSELEDQWRRYRKASEPNEKSVFHVTVDRDTSIN